MVIIFGHFKFLIMTDTLITGIFTLLGAAVGGLLTFLGNKHLVDHEDAKKEILKLSNQIISYWHLEKEYYTVLSTYLNKSPQTTQLEFRKKVQENDFDRPIMTENDIKNIISKWNLK